MIVLLEEIREGGLAVDRPLTEAYLQGVLHGDGPDTGFRPAGEARLKGRFDKVGDKVLLHGDTKVRVATQCRRCLADVQVDVPVHFELNLVARRKEEAEEDPEAEHEAFEDQAYQSTAADEETFEGREIDLGRIVREQILLALPMDGLCKDDCKGLCTVCGQDLNVKDCGCQRKVADPRWAALKDIKLN